VLLTSKLLSRLNECHATVIKELRILMSYFAVLDGYPKLAVSLNGTHREREKFLDCSLTFKFCCCFQIYSGSKVETGILSEGRESLGCSQ